MANQIRPMDEWLSVAKTDLDYQDAVHPQKGLKFWLIFTSMCICLFLSALELASVSTALPTIADALHTSQFTWVGSAYALASTAFLPMSGGLAQVFGRRPAILVAIGLFAIGSGISGAAINMNMLISGRVIQGLGGGGIQSLTGIILADLVPLQERGLYGGLYGITWCIAASIGPLVGGVLAAHGQWRWLFYMNLPISLMACGSVILLLDLPTPPGTYREKIMRIDWIGNFLVIASTTTLTIALTWGGITHPWVSYQVLLPVVLGLVGLFVFMSYEATLARNPLVPFSILTNMTSISGYIQTFCCFLVIYAIVYYYPVYFQACKGASASASGLDLLPISVLAPAAVLGGLSVKRSGRYRPQTWLAWVITCIALGVMTTVNATTHMGVSFGAVAMFGWGIGMLSATSMYPIQAPLPVSKNAPALAFMWFLRSFSGVWGITIGTTVLQNELAKRLPAAFIQSIPQGTAIMYALIPELSHLPPETMAQVQVSFAESLAVLWRVLTGIGGVGLVASLFMKGVPLHNKIDTDWAPVNKAIQKGDDEEPVTEAVTIEMVSISHDKEKESPVAGAVGKEERRCCG